nr:MAG TPA: Replication initiation and membrane attachment [Caudoviricetes sp.]
MATNKRYYWIKLKEEFFTDKRIKRLRRISGGDTYTIIYLKLLLLSLKDEGKLYYDGVESDFIKELALTIDETDDDVMVTVNYLINQGLLEVVTENDEYYLTEIPNLIGSETAWAEKKRRYRQNKQRTLSLMSPTHVRQEIAIEKDIEIEHRDRDITISTTRENKEIENSQSLTPMSNIDIYDLWTNSFGVISSFVKGSLDDLIAEYGLVNVADALRIAKERGKSRVQYVEGILKNQRLENGANGRNGSTRATTRQDEQVDWEQEAAKTYGQD